MGVSLSHLQLALETTDLHEEEMGRGFSASAISKKAARKGKAIDGMEDGWVDMEEDDDDEPPPPPKGKK